MISLINITYTWKVKIHIVKAMVFVVLMFGCWRWNLKKAECQRSDVFELWYLRRLLRVTWTTRRSNQSILKEINSEYSLEGLMLKLKLQYFGHLMPRADSLEKTPTLGKIEGRRRRRWQRMSWLDNITNSVDMNLSKLQEIVEDRGAWHAAVHGVTKSQTRLSGWTIITICKIKPPHPSPSSWFMNSVLYLLQIIKREGDVKYEMVCIIE